MSCPQPHRPLHGGAASSGFTPPFGGPGPPSQSPPPSTDNAVPGAGTQCWQAGVGWQPWCAPGPVQALWTRQHFVLSARGTEQLQAPSPSPGPAQGGITPVQGRARVRSEAGAISGKSVRGERQHGKSHAVPVSSLSTHPLAQPPAELPSFRGSPTVHVAPGSSRKTHFHPDPLGPRPSPRHAAALRPTHKVLLLLTYGFHVSRPSWARTSQAPTRSSPSRPWSRAERQTLPFFFARRPHLPQQKSFSLPSHAWQTLKISRRTQHLPSDAAPAGHLLLTRRKAEGRWETMVPPRRGGRTVRRTQKGSAVSLGQCFSTTPERQPGHALPSLLSF